MHKRVRGALAGVVLLGVVTGLVYTQLRSDHFYDGWMSVRLGMTRTQTDAVLGKGPDHLSRYGPYEIAYYVRPEGFLLSFGGLANWLPNDLPTEVYRLSDLPWVYSAVQAAFDAKGRLAAFAWNGEGVRVVTRTGIVRGVRLSELSAEYLEGVEQQDRR